MARRLPPGIEADLGVGREARCFHRGCIGVGRHVVWHDQDRNVAGAHEIPADGEDEIGIGAVHIVQELRHHITGIVDLALDEPELSPRELAVTFTDAKSYFVSEASVYRLLKAHDLITSPAFIVIKAADEFYDKTTAPNQLWQTDFTYLKVIGWGWFYLSTILDDYSRYIIAWKLCGGRCDRDAGTGTESIRMRQPQCHPQTEAAQR